MLPAASLILGLNMRVPTRLRAPVTSERRTGTWRRAQHGADSNVPIEPCARTDRGHGLRKARGRRQHVNIPDWKMNRAGPGQQRMYLCGLYHEIRQRWQVDQRWRRVIHCGLHCECGQRAGATADASWTLATHADNWMQELRCLC